MTMRFFAVLIALTAILTIGVAAGLTVEVAGLGAPDTAGGPYSKLSLAVAYVVANSSPPNVINVTTNYASDDTQILATVPMTINGDGETAGVGDGTPCYILVLTNATNGIGLAGDVGETGKAYIEVETAGSVVINDLQLGPDVNGNTTNILIDPIAMYKPASGTGDYTLNRVQASSTNTSLEFSAPASTTDAYYVPGAHRWYAYGGTHGIFNLTNSGGAGNYNATLIDCQAAAARSHDLNIQNQSGTTVINGGVYSYAGQDNIRITGTNVTLTGSLSNRIRLYRASSSSAGESLRLETGADVTLMEYVDSIDALNAASGFSFYNGTVQEMRFCRTAGCSGSDFWAQGTGTVLDAHDITSHASGASVNPLATAVAHTGSLFIKDSIFTSTGIATSGEVLCNGTTGVYSILYCALPTDGAAGESLNATTPVVGVTPTNSVITSPAYMDTTFDITDPGNVDFLRPSNATDYRMATSTALNLAGGAGGNTVPADLSTLSTE
jgi:hypothetical protein